MGNYFQQEIECAPREQILAMQNEKLVKQVQHVWEHVPYYRKKMEEKGVRPEDIKSVADLHKLPFLSKKDLRNAYPYGMLAVPLKDCVRIHSTSGTAAPGPSWRQGAPLKMCARFPTATAFSPAGQGWTAAPTRWAA